MREERRNIPASIPESNTIDPHLNAAPSPAAVASSFNHPPGAFLSWKCKISKDETDLKVEWVTNSATAWTWVGPGWRSAPSSQTCSHQMCTLKSGRLGGLQDLEQLFIHHGHQKNDFKQRTDGRCSPAAAQLWILGGALTLMRPCLCFHECCWGMRSSDITHQILNGCLQQINQNGWWCGWWLKLFQWF